MRKRILAFTVALALIISHTMLAFAAAAYSKASDWAKPELSEAYKNGLIPASLVGADMTRPITREEFAEVAVKLYEKSVGTVVEAPSKNPFADTSNPEILKAFLLGITNGTSPTTFNPKGYTNREQVASMLSRTIRIMNPLNDFSAEGVPSFSDQKAISSWAQEHVLYMAKLGIIKGTDGKFIPHSSTTREQAIAMSLRTYNSLNDISTSVSYDWERIVINDFPILESDYVITEEGDSVGIFVSSDKLKYAIKFPTLNLEGISPYMELEQSGNNISIYWLYNNEPVYRFDMTVGSTHVLFEEELFDMGLAPFQEDGKTFIPVNVFVEAFDMGLIDDSSQNILLIQFKEGFPSSYLEGVWSDTHTDLFTLFKDVPSGKVGLSSFTQSHIYNSDGTYRIRMMSVGGFKDTYIEQSGKYKVMGHTIMYYGITETVYEGSPFALKYKNRPLNQPSFDFIEAYKQESNEIKIGGFWLHSN